MTLNCGFIPCNRELDVISPAVGRHDLQSFAPLGEASAIYVEISCRMRCVPELVRCFWTEVRVVAENVRKVRARLLSLSGHEIGDEGGKITVVLAEGTLPQTRFPEPLQGGRSSQEKVRNSSPRILNRLFLIIPRGTITYI